MNEKPLIMIVDDDPNIAQLINLYLTKDGFDTVIYGRGDEALEAFRQNPFFVADPSDNDREVQQHDDERDH